MKSHYSIISALVRPEIQEKITIGLLLVSPNEVVFSVSKNKIAAVRLLIDASLFRFLNETVKQIEQAVEQENSKQGTLFENEEQSAQFSLNYLSYLNRYSNNLMQFSSPIQIDLPANEGLYSFLFRKYIDETIAIQRQAKTIGRVKEEFYPKIRAYYNTDREISPRELSSLPMSVNIDIIGKNEIPVFAQVIDFERSVYNIRQDVGVLQFLMDAYDGSTTKSYLVGNEPDKKYYAKSHAAWEDLRKWKKIAYLPIDEIDQIKEYAEKHGVLPLFN